MATESLPIHDVKDLGLAGKGKLRIEWAEAQMPVLRLIRERFKLRGRIRAVSAHAGQQNAHYPGPECGGQGIEKNIDGGTATVHGFAVHQSDSPLLEDHVAVVGGNQRSPPDRLITVDSAMADDANSVSLFSCEDRM